MRGDARWHGGSSSDSVGTVTVDYRIACGLSFARIVIQVNLVTNELAGASQL